MEAGDRTNKRHLLGLILATAVFGALLGPAQALAGGSLTANPNPVAFGNVVVGSSSAINVQVTNTTANLIMDDSITGASEFSTDSGCDGQSPTNANPCTIQVTFSPTTQGSRMATLTIPNDGSTPNFQVPLSGTGVTRSLTLSPASKDFGSVNVGSQSAPQTFTATSDGTDSVTISQISVLSTGFGEFPTSNNTCQLPETLMPTETCTVDVSFAPVMFPGARTGTLRFESNAPDSPDTAALSGTTPLPYAAVPILPLAPTPTTPPKKCKKGFKLKRGKCVRKKKKKKK